MCIKVKIEEKSFDKIIIEDFKYTFECGKIYTLFAANGSGKSTLVEILSGIDTGFKGEIKFSTNNNSIPKISFMPQNYISSLLPWYDIKTNIHFPQKKDSNNQILEKLQLSDKLEILIENLSRGYMQRVAIAKCLMKKASVYILDEPFSALDYWDKDIIKEILIQSINNNKCIIVVTHNVKDAFDISHEVIVFNNNKQIDKNFKIFKKDTKSKENDLVSFINNNIKIYKNEKN